MPFSVKYSGEINLFSELNVNLLAYMNEPEAGEDLLVKVTL
jgi:hypothetical protein